ncbi:MAG: hypothetical protein ABFC56_10440 [Clostridiaceae bacterium]
MNQFDNSKTKGLVKAYANGGDFVARDSDGGLYSYSQAPYKCKDGYWWKDDMVEKLDPEDAKFVTWEDERPIDLWQYFKALDSEANQTPPTHKDVLLERWKKDTEAMASLMLFHNPLTGQIGACGMDGMVFAWFEWIKDALAAQIAYLNSAAEVGK